MPSIDSEKKIISRVVPVLSVGDVKEAAKWYEKSLGFQTESLHSADEDAPGFGIVQRDGIYIYLGLDKSPGNSYTSIMVFDVGALYENVKKEGLQIFEELTKRDWGPEAFQIDDPWGNRLHVEQEV